MYCIATLRLNRTLFHRSSPQGWCRREVSIHTVCGCSAAVEYGFSCPPALQSVAFLLSSSSPAVYGVPSLHVWVLALCPPPSPPPPCPACVTVPVCTHAILFKPITCVSAGTQALFPWLILASSIQQTINSQTKDLLC